ncbi:hypothetical protein JKF63_00807 [Porcisia hertigi]|uniref:Uncharacterized protein n=1 Tax=Porcisia hertigi TaxID=2761500 RepID=A0A836L1D8_9TRYP|nr:hypothetical protein JKF63_00807 [Porcisia hertigi]
MDPIVVEASRVREAILENRFRALYIAPQPPHRRPAGSRRVHSSAQRCGKSSCSPHGVHAEPSPPAAVKTLSVTQPDPRSALFPARPLDRSSEFACASPPRRHHSPPPETQEKVAAAAQKTLARLRMAQHTSLLYSEQARASPLGGWQPLVLTAVSNPPLRRSAASIVCHAHSEILASGTTSAAPARPSAREKELSKTSLKWRLRRGDGGMAFNLSASGKQDAPLAEKQQHPLQVLQFLGSAVVDDSLVSTDLPSLNLRMASCRVSSPAQPTEKPPPSWQSLRVRVRPQTRARRARLRAETLAVHIGDAEARTYRVEVQQGEVSPLESLLKAYPECVWDGSEFLLLPLLDKQGEAIEVLPPAIADESSVGVRGTDEGRYTVVGADAAPHTGLGVEMADEVAFPDIVSTFWRSTDVSFSGEGGGSGAGILLDTPSPDFLERATMGGTGSGVNSTGSLARSPISFPTDGVASADAPVVPRWKRFCTTAALYLTLGKAGCCDVACFPYVAVRLCAWDDLVGHQRIRIEAKVSGATTALNALKRGTDRLRSRRVPVAVLFPMSRKGVMRRPWSLTTQPFTDGEVFQLFYLQLLFRAYFDIRFRGMTFTLPGQHARYLRADLVAARSSGSHHVAFEHPLNRHEWLLFPAHTRLLTLLNLEEAVVPLYATPAELQETTSLPLFGAGDTLPCLGDVGCSVAQWASTVEVSSPETALLALVALFEKMKGQFGCTRGELWRRTTGNAHDGTPSFTPLLFRCGEFTAGAALRRFGGALSHFFVSPSNVASSSSAVSEESATGPLHVGDTLAATAVSDPLLPCMPTGESTSTTGASAASSSARSSLTIVQRRLNTVDTMKPFLEVSLHAVSECVKHRQDRDRAEKNIRAFDAVDLVSTKSPEGALGAVKGIPYANGSSVIVGTTAARGPSTAAALIATVDASQGKGNAGPEASALLVLEKNAHVELDEATTVCNQSLNAYSVGPSSLPKAQKGLATRWCDYVQTGNCTIFDGPTNDVELLELMGRGGSSLVFRGTYGPQRYPVAVKVFVIPDGLNQEQYVRESLIDVAFYVLVNQLEDLKVCKGGRAHDFIVSQQTPKGLPAEAADELRRGADGATTKLCYLVTDLMDGTLGRFLTECDAGFDPYCDQLLNSPLRDGELFQFLFFQLAIKALFDWKVLDMVLMNQLRGDNIGYCYVALPPAHSAYLREHPKEDAPLSKSRQYYAGILYRFQFGSDEPLQYLRFPADTGAADDAGLGPLRFIYMIDLGQGMQPNVAELVRKRYIGETVLESCVVDDGLGRYWPLDELYCRCVNVEGDFAKSVVVWGSARRVTSQEEAFHALRELFDQFYPTFGVEAPTEEELQTYLCLSWTPANARSHKAACVYQTD